MDTSAAALLGGVVGAVLGVASVLAWRLSERSQQRVPASEEPAIPPGVSAVLSVLRSSALVVGPDDRVLKASAPAYVLGLVYEAQVAVEDLLDMVRAVRRDGQIRERELAYRQGRTEEAVVRRGQPAGRAAQGVPRGGTPGAERSVVARVAPLSSRLVLVLAEDRTRERRVEAIRRDFVANVSHELMTPVGALNVLTDALTEAADDPGAVHRFAGGMRTEVERLTRLVRQIIELSRIQGDDPLDHEEPVPVDAVVRSAVDRVEVEAHEKGLRVCVTGERGVRVAGERDQLEAALSNLVENAVAYSPAGRTVTVSVGRSGPVVDVRVTDQGVGIPESEVDRIFERFYRVDPARARSTGGTGLGLSIVKHVAAIHGGRVDVWSVEDEGSTFTISLPALPATTGVEAGELS